MATGSDPFADLLTLQRDVDRLMTRFGAQPRHAGEDGHSFWTPPVDVFKQGTDMVVRIDLPGVSPSDINVSITGNMLTIKGERRKEQALQEGDWVLQESRYGSFERRVTLPQDIDASQVHAQYRAGVLEITVPRAALVTPQPRDIAVTGPRQAVSPGQQQPAQQQYETPAQPYRQTETQDPDRPMQETGSQAYGAGHGEQQTQAFQVPDETTPERQSDNPPVGVEGGWVRPRDEQAPAEEEKPRSGLGSWLHGSGS